MEFQYSPIHYMTKDGKKINLYYKRLPKPSSKSNEDSLYTMLNSKKIKSPDPKINSEFPYQRALIVISFEINVKDEEVKDIFRTLGKLRSIDSGLSKKKGEKEFKFFVIVFKAEKDLKKAFEQEFFQTITNEKFKGKLRGVVRSEKYLQDLFLESSLIHNEDGPRIDEDGFVAVDEDDQFRDDSERFVTRKRKKKETVKSDFYKFQISRDKSKSLHNLNLEEDGIEATRKRIKLEFEKDIERLNEIRQNHNF